MWENFILGTIEQTSQISKTSLAKIGHTAVSKPQAPSKKTGCDKYESWKKFFPYPYFGFFHQNHPFYVIHHSRQ